MARPKLLYILHSYNNHAGTEEHTRILATRLTEQFEVHCIFPDQQTIWWVCEGRTMKSAPAGAFDWPMTAWEDPVSQGALGSMIEELSPDLVHVQHFFRWPLGILEDLLIRFGKKLILSFHDYYALTPEYTYQSGGVSDQDFVSPAYAQRTFGKNISGYLKERLHRLKPIISAIPLKVVPSNHLRSELSKYFSGEFAVIEHRIDPFQCVEHVPYSEGVRFGYISGMIQPKGYTSLFEAFAKVRKRHPKARLLAHGWGSGFSADPYLESGIEFFGPYQPEQMGEILSRIDVGVIPSIFRETYCLALSKFHYAGIPVAASRIGALADRLKEGTDGKFFVPNDPESIAQILEWFLTTESWRAWKPSPPRLADEMARDYDALYRSVLRL